ncbi:MAG: hypothetical protein JST39_03280 [Bacteroidetes bacterium]|nr:hypothetical protein [Bacteroidota bacterium]
MYSTGRNLFATYGYADIGMDHFALPNDELHKAWREGRLHRNFMGYTSRRTKLLLGLGVSAISDAGGGYAQNSKTIAGYYEALQEDRLAVEKGYFLTEQDKVFRDHILDIACRSKTIFNPQHMPAIEQWVLPVLRNLEQDGLVCLYADGVTVTARGRYFLRNICRAFDLKLSQQVTAGSKAPQFSKAL